MLRSTTMDGSVQIHAFKQDCRSVPSELPPPFPFPSPEKNTWVFTGCLHHLLQEQQPPKHHQPSPMFLLHLNTRQLPRPFRDAEKSKTLPSRCPFTTGTGPEIFTCPSKVPFGKTFDQDFQSTLKINILLSSDLLLSWRRKGCQRETSVPFIEHLSHEGNKQ